MDRLGRRIHSVCGREKSVEARVYRCYVDQGQLTTHVFWRQFELRFGERYGFFERYVEILAFRKITRCVKKILSPLFSDEKTGSVLYTSAIYHYEIDDI